jgi:hypothetical protein
MGRDRLLYSAIDKMVVPAPENPLNGEANAYVILDAAGKLPL